MKYGEKGRGHYAEDDGSAPPEVTERDSEQGKTRR